MKYFQAVCVLGMLLTASVSFSGPVAVSDLIVSGSYDPLVNGTYTYNGDYGGKSSWVKGSYYLRWDFTSSMTVGWVIYTAQFTDYYWNDTGPTLPDEVGWNCLSGAANPCTPPVVTEDPLPETLIVSGTFDSFLNGSYTRESLNANGYPQYTMGGYTIYATGGMVSWNIEDASNQYYIHYDSSQASVPEVGWSLGTDGGSQADPSPPVVTSYQVPDTVIVSGTVDSFLNGNWTRQTLNSATGYPQYTMGDYGLYVEGSWMFPWVIDQTSSGIQFYSNDQHNGALVPEYSWSLGLPAGSPASPPVVSVVELPEKYRVLGAGSSDVNGIYTRVLNSVDGLVYEKEPYFKLEAGHFITMAYGYGITKSGNTYYAVENDTLLIPSSGWIVGAHGTANPPYVWPYTFPWQMYLPSVTGREQ